MTKKKNEKIDVKIGTPEEALWSRVRDEATEMIKQRKNELIIQNEILELAEKKIKETQKNNK